MTKKKLTKHTQCKLMNPYNEYMVSWIPSKFAHHGKFVKLQNDKGEWEDGWMVIEVHTELPTKYVEERSRDYARTRKASDI